ncbi:hypothetical protein GT037_000184 [Alternaria burnsii]|uniref:Uncharacterized protein n=1 Tax=Alternaria burnsii TaxID=1187904 RepID=A0A8H7BFZ3_9PLEO|nr:uncharacterized protein GT037_000184 [Alternaria burnsii]KAF7681208.1 hypothetical protein GT037_000184 [Alternaria burnsii]
MVEPEAGILRLPIELRQMIYDYIISAKLNRTIKVTLDRDGKIRFENCKFILNLVCTDTVFTQEVPSYLFEHFTFILTDSSRSCYLIVNAFFYALSPKNRVCVRKIGIPFFTNRDHFGPPRPSLQRDDLFSSGVWDSPEIANLKWRQKKNTHEGLIQKDLTQEKLLRKAPSSALLLLNSMPALENLELGVDVTEVIGYIDSETFILPSSSEFLIWLATIRSSGTFALNHPLSIALHSIKGMGKLRQVELKLKWSNFIFDSYNRAGCRFPQEWTQIVKEELEGLFEDFLRREPWPGWPSRSGDKQSLIPT